MSLFFLSFTDVLSDDLIDRDTLKERMGKLKDETTKLMNSKSSLLTLIQQKDALMDDYYAELTTDVLDKYSHLEPTLRRELLQRYLTHAYVRNDGFEIEFLNGKKFVTDMWEKKKKILNPLTMTVSFKGEEQYKAILSFPGFKMVDEDYGDEQTNLFFSKRNKEVENRVTFWLEKFLSTDK